MGKARDCKQVMRESAEEEETGAEDRSKEEQRADMSTLVRRILGRKS